jgi:hypothetical protein
MINQPVTDATMREQFELWYAKSGALLRPERTKDEWWTEYVTACNDAAHPLWNDEHF